ncbi:MAG TPA: PIG-L family deacetylase, partial [Terriglobales bacterium]
MPDKCNPQPLPAPAPATFAHPDGQSRRPAKRTVRDTISAMLRLMCITAHPDDEAGAFGGTLRLYRDRGVETCVLCLTPGQAATHRGGVKSDQ